MNAWIHLLYKLHSLTVHFLIFHAFQGCNFLESLTREDYTKCLDYLKNMILATDLANHFKIHSRQLQMAQVSPNNNVILIKQKINYHQKFSLLLGRLR